MTAATSSYKLVRLLRGGQMNIPVEFCQALGITEDTMLYVTLKDGALHIHPVEFKKSKPGEKQGSPELKALYDYFAPTRAAILASGITEDELNADIDAAVAAVRAERRASQE
jgi:hypothetical protein